MFNRLISSCVLVLMFGCGVQEEEKAEPQTETRTDAVFVECPLQNPGSGQVLFRTEVWNGQTGRCGTRGSGYTTARVFNERPWAVNVRVGAFWWWQDVLLQPRGSSGDWVDFRREFFGVSFETSLLTYGTVSIQTY